MIAESAIKAKVGNYSKLANFVGGRKLELFLQVNILIYMWGSCISYQIISRHIKPVTNFTSLYSSWEIPLEVRRGGCRILQKLVVSRDSRWTDSSPSFVTTLADQRHERLQAHQCSLNLCPHLHRHGAICRAS